jgi:hypothetical protein
VVVANGMLSMVVANAEYGWLWHSDRIGNRMKAILDDCLSDFVRKKAKGMIGSIVGAMVATALCDWHLSMKIVAEAEYGFCSSFSWTPKRLGSLLFNNLYHFRDTCNTEACLSFDLDLALSQAYCPFGYNDLSCARRIFPSFLAEVGRNSFPNFLLGRNCLN